MGPVCLISQSRFEEPVRPWVQPISPLAFANNREFASRVSWDSFLRAAIKKLRIYPAFEEMCTATQKTQKVMFFDVKKPLKNSHIVSFTRHLITLSAFSTELPIKLPVPVKLTNVKHVAQKWILKPKFRQTFIFSNGSELITLRELGTELQWSLSEVY